MATMECPRCVAERRARRVRSTANVVLGVGVGVFVVPCWWGSAAVDATGETRVMLMAVVHHLGWCFLLMLLCAGVSALIGRRARSLSHRASVSLPPPQADPLATYREAPLECPRHPFAR